MKRFFVAIAIMLSITSELLGANSILERADGLTTDTGSHVFYLEPRQIQHNLTIFSNIHGSSVEFKKEPDLGKWQVSRGVLAVGNKKENYLPFAWNKIDGKLYIDFNRNLDLTDDGKNIFIRSFNNPSYQQYENIPLPLKFGNKATTYTVNITYQPSYRGDIFDIHIKTAWCGEIELHGKKWLLAVQDSGNGVLNDEDLFMLLPPDSTHLEDSSFLEFSALKSTTPEFFIGEHLYNINMEMMVKDDKVLVRAEFKERPVEKGRLDLTGSYIKRLILKGNNTVILDRPTSSVMIPIGSYLNANIMLENKDSKWRATNDQKLMGINITKEKPFLLKQGGPLRNVASARHYYKGISIEYQMVGAGGETYSLPWLDYRYPPRFVIYQGDKKIHAGIFSYG